MMTFLKKASTLFMFLGTLLFYSMVYAGHGPLFTAVNMLDESLILINTETDEIIIKSLIGLPGWPGGRLQHSWVTKDGKTIHVDTDVTDVDPGRVITLNVDKIDWGGGLAELRVTNVVVMDPAGRLSNYPPVMGVDPMLPIAGWVIQPFTMGHGPTFLPSGLFSYFTNWTDNRIRVLDPSGAFAMTDPISFGKKSRQTHGIHFNASGKLGLGTGYFYDSNAIDVYQVAGKGGRLRHIKSIKLGTNRAYAAFTHYTVWLNNRFALTASMQLGPTSLTPKGARIIGPSVWLLDVRRGSAKMIIGPTADVAGNGIFRSGSDLMVAKNKLYVGESDELDDSFGDDGYVSIFDISNVSRPKFIKRLRPGVELPPDFAVAHAMAVTPDQNFVYVSSYATHHIIKIDTATDTVVKVFDRTDGLDMPHGEFIQGNYR
jgi:hypothetical protein